MTKNRAIRILVWGIMLVLLFPFPAIAKAENNPTFQNASVHDPSIIKVKDTFYVFGSHLAAAKSNNLISWEQIADGVHPGNPLIPNALEEMKETFEWAESETFWATDVIQLEDGRFYMYYNSSRGDSPRSAMGVAVADNVEGPYKDLGIILKSGMVKEPSEDGTPYDATDHPNVVDPHVFFDEQGKLWMVYGSYSGGIYILEIDPKTAKPYPDQGYGKKLLGANHSRIEGPYIQYSAETGYYYLFLSFGGLDSVGGYNLRVARSENPDGPYFDSEGNNMIDAHGPEGSFFDDKAIEPFGVKLIGNFTFQSYKDHGTEGYVSPGHNSTFYDKETGKFFNIFHTRFPNKGERHEIRVHQMFMNEDGWPVMAPYRYTGEKLKKIHQKDIIGNYQFINHEKDISADLKKAQNITLKDDGTISGERTGTWELKDDYTAILKIEGNTYKGVFLEQWNSVAGSEGIVFTALSNEGKSIWGICDLDRSDEEIVELTKKELDLGDTSEVTSDLTLQTDGISGAKVTWESSHPKIISTEGKVIRPAAGEKDQEVTLTATISKGEAKATKSFIVTVLAEVEGKLVAHYSFDGDLEDQTNHVDAGKVVGEQINLPGGKIPFTDGKFGQAAQFDGSSGILLPEGLIHDDSYTVSLWLNPEELTEFTTTFFGAQTEEQWVSLVPRGPVNGETMVWSGEEWFDGNTGMTIPSSEWSHLAFTVEEGTLNVYINGEKKFSDSGFPNVFTSKKAIFSLGVNYWDQAYKGLMDELLVYNSIALSEEQISTYFKTGEIPLQASSIDVSELEKLIEKAKQYANEDGQYTKESFQALQEAITEAESALPTIKSEEDLKKAIQSLDTAIKGLKLVEKKPDTKDPETNGDKDAVPIKDKNDPDKNKGKEEKQKKGKELPNTATFMYSSMAIGLLLFISGIIWFYVRRKVSIRK